MTALVPGRGGHGQPPGGVTGRRYQPYYCEENAWHLCQEPELAELAPSVVFVTNEHRACPLWHQRAAPAGEPVLWDYHVVVLTEAAGPPQVWDLDSRLGCPVPAVDWLRETFSGLDGVAEPFHPRFRVVSARDLVATFSSDRRHMRRPGGGWVAPPPPWPPVFTRTGGHNLDRFLELGASEDQRFVGEILDLAAFRRRVEAPAG